MVTGAVPILVSVGMKICTSALNVVHAFSLSTHLLVLWIFAADDCELPGTVAHKYEYAKTHIM